MNKEATEQDLECKTISSRNYVFSPAPTLNKENFKYIFEHSCTFYSNREGKARIKPTEFSVPWNP